MDFFYDVKIILVNTVTYYKKIVIESQTLNLYKLKLIILD